jgi:uroporphyrinogen decarboxylase
MKMNARERFRAVMNFESVPTLKWEFGYWAATVRRWYEEGLEAKAGLEEQWKGGVGVHGGAAGWRPGRPLGQDINQAVDLDESLQRMLFNNYLAPPFEEETLEEHGDWILVRNDMGMIEKRYHERGSLSAYLEGPVSTMEDWERLKAERLRPSLEDRLPPDWASMKESYRERSFPLALGGGQGFFGTPRFLLGEIQVLTASYDNPDLLRQIINDLADFWIALYDLVLDEVTVDLMMFWEDICFNNGPLISPRVFEEFILPAYKKITRFLLDRGIKNIIVDTDGDVWKLLPLFIEGGVTGMYPFEVNAGMDVVEVRKAFPNLQILGGFSRASLAASPEEIDAEMEAKVPWMLQRSGYIPYMDHLVPPDVPWDNFCYYRKRLNALIDASHSQ